LACPEVDVLAGGAPAFTNVVNGGEGTADLPAGVVSASVVPTGTTEPVVIGPADLAVDEGANLIVYAVGSLEDGTLGVLTESITGLGTAPAAIETGTSPVSDDGTGRNLTAVGLLSVVLGAGVLGVRRLAVARTR
jgi:hypothetical protein